MRKMFYFLKTDCDKVVKNWGFDEMNRHKKRLSSLKERDTVYDFKEPINIDYTGQHDFWYQETNTILVPRNKTHFWG